MDVPKYSEIENERRFLVRSLADVNLDELGYTQLDDLYIDDSRMRLRSAKKMGESIVYKLCKKYPTDDRYAGAIVNTYLSAEEFALFSRLPGRPISKKRYVISYEQGSFSINVFDGQLNGLILCEAERSTRAQLCSLQFPSWAVTEVTEDEFFTGGHLAGVTSEELHEKLRSMDQ